MKNRVRKQGKVLGRPQGMRGADLDWLCKKGCEEWIPWYRDKKGKVVYGCRLGLIPERVAVDGIAEIVSQTVTT